VLDPSFLQDVNVNILPRADNTYDLGSSSLRWRDVWAGRSVRSDTVRPISDYVNMGGFNLLTMTPYVDNALGFRRPYRVERWDGTAWVDITDARDWGILTDGRGTFIELIDFGYTADAVRLRFYYDFGGRWVSPAQLLVIHRQHFPYINYLKVEQADDAGFTTGVEVLREVTTTIHGSDSTNIIPTLTFWKRYLRIEIEGSRPAGYTGRLRLYEIAYYAPPYWSGVRLLGSMIPLDWDTYGNLFTRHLQPLADNTYNLGGSTRRWRDLYLAGSATVGGVANVGSLQVGGATVVDSSRRLMNLASVAQSLLPDSDGTFDLGSPTLRWRDIYAMVVKGALISLD